MSADPVKLGNGFRLQWEEAQNSYVLLYPEGMVKLNDAAGEILNQVDGEKSPDQIITALEQKFPGADLADDVREFLGIASEKGWLA